MSSVIFPVLAVDSKVDDRVASELKQLNSETNRYRNWKPPFFSTEKNNRILTTLEKTLYDLLIDI